MAMISISVNDLNVKKLLDKVTHVTDDLSKPMTQIGLYVMRATDLRFRNQVAPDGAKWKGLSKSTERQRRKGKGKCSNQILQDSGTLMKSLTKKGSSGVNRSGGSGSNVFRVDKNSVSVGTSGLPYANIHQFGGTIKIPPRKSSVTFAYNRHGDLYQGFKSPESRYKNLISIDTRHSGYTINMPARPSLGINKADAKTCREILAKNVNSILHGGSR